jgi:small-conductance mechanosensitive channel/CRP-like cAMP-binding protein
MTGLANLTAAARDPLVATLLLFCLGGLCSHFFFRRQALTRAVLRVVFLVVLSVVLLHAGVVPYEPLTRTGVPLEDAVRAVLKIAWWLWTAWLLVGFLRVFVVAEHRPREGKLVQDLLAGLIYIAALFAIIAYVFDLPIQGLLATSGIVAIILGLALQSTLSDVFSGIVLNFSRPYRPGDWISVDGATDGRVIEMNWRATHILTAKRDLAIVPNSTIAKAKIINASSPSGIHGMTVAVQLDPNAAPAGAAEILRQAILNTRPILTTPPPQVAVKSIAADATGFELSFFVEELPAATKAQNELFDWISRHLAASGITLSASQSQPASMIPAAPATARNAGARAMDLVAIFAGLTEEERRALAAKAKCSHYDEGSIVVAQGQVLHSLFIIGVGVVSATALASEGEIELLRLGPGDHYGEIGMLTGHAALATLKALAPVTIYELGKDDLAPVLEARPEVSHDLCQALARRHAMLQLIASPDIDKSLPPSRVAAWFSDRLHRLFDLAGAE